MSLRRVLQTRSAGNVVMSLRRVLQTRSAANVVRSVMQNRWVKGSIPASDRCYLPDAVGWVSWENV